MCVCVLGMHVLCKFGQSSLIDFYTRTQLWHRLLIRQVVYLFQKAQADKDDIWHQLFHIVNFSIYNR